MAGGAAASAMSAAHVEQAQMQHLKTLFHFCLLLHLLRATSAKWRFDTPHETLCAALRGRLLP